MPGPPCEHITDLIRLNLELRAWYKLLETAFPNKYHDDPPQAPSPHIALDRETRVAMMAMRVAEGYSPFREGDHVDMPEDMALRATGWSGNHKITECELEGDDCDSQ